MSETYTMTLCLKNDTGLVSLDSIIQDERDRLNARIEQEKAQLLVLLEEEELLGILHKALVTAKAAKE
jgi:hypothetical protein